MSPTITPTKNSSGPNTVPRFERQVLSSQVLRELRVACALIVKETGPSGAELEAILNQADPLETYNKEVAKVRAKAASTQQSSFPTKSARQKDRTSKSNIVSTNQSSTTLPLPRPQSNVYTSNHRSATALTHSKTVVEPPRPVNPKPTEKQIARKSVPVRDRDALAKIRSSMSLRPKTSAAASIDYMATTVGSSGSTTRSNTTAEPRISTNVTSFNQTPADDKRGSYQFPKGSTSRGASSLAWRAEDASSEHVRDLFAANPDYDVPSLHHARTAPMQSMVSREPSRPRSRASSIKDSIIGGIRDYIQPRPSLEALTRSASRNRSMTGSRNSSRPPSRGSSFSQSSRGWIKSAASGLRRKGSFSSWKPNRPEDEDRGRNKTKGPDLNRSLPPLPGLDSYKEPKVHISQMMSMKSPPPTEIAAPKKTSKASAPTSPWSPGQQNSVTSGITNPQDSARSFPRIPFSDGEPRAVEVRYAQVTSPTRSKEHPKEKQMRENEKQRPRQEKHKKTHSKDLKNQDIDKNQEEEIRRAVRERIMQGGLTREQFNSEEGMGQQVAQMPQYATQDNKHLSQHGLTESFKKRERHKKVDRETKIDSEEALRRSRSSHWNEKSHDATPPKRTLKSRLSRLIKHDHNFGQGEGSAIVAN